jgi:hypothetical protein
VSKYTPDRQPTEEELDQLADYFHRMAGVAEGDALDGPVPGCG